MDAEWCLTVSGREPNYRPLEPRKVCGMNSSFAAGIISHSEGKTCASHTKSLCILDTPHFDKWLGIPAAVCRRGGRRKDERRVPPLTTIATTLKSLGIVWARAGRQECDTASPATATIAVCCAGNHGESGADATGERE